MKNIFKLVRCGRLAFLVFCLLTITKPLRAQWIQINVPFDSEVTSFAVSGMNLFAGTEGDGVFLSTNYGTSWTEVNTGLTNTYVWTFAVSGTNLFAGANYGVFLSTNSGTSWTEINTGLTGSLVLALAVSGANLLAGTYYGGVFLSTNNGTNWIEVNSDLTSTFVYALAVSGTNLFAGTEVPDFSDAGGVYLSTNNGTSWAITSLRNISVYAFAVSGPNLFAGTGGGVFLSTNNGTNWTEVNEGLTNTVVNTFAVSGPNLFTGTWGGGVFFSTNNGTSWIEFNTGLTNHIVKALGISGKYLYAGTPGGVWRRVLYDMITKVERLSTVLPTHFSLDQNYPNPFNPSTNISFSLPSRLFASLKVFDFTGREVATIVSEELSAGIYSQQWNANGLPSGVYFYRLQAGTFTETKKLILLK